MYLNKNVVLITTHTRPNQPTSSGRAIEEDACIRRNVTAQPSYKSDIALQPLYDCVNMVSILTGKVDTS